MVPLFVFVGIDITLYLPIAIWVIPKDKNYHKPLSTNTP